MDIITLLVGLIVILVVFGVFHYCISLIPDLPPIIRAIGYIVLALVAVIVLLNFASDSGVLHLHLRK